MTVMTEGLRALAGRRLRATLLRFTRTPLSGAIAGAAGTALLQSSSATTVATVGFVSAGLIRFESSLGIIFGANIGSTGLGWLVAVIGLKLNITSLFTPAILVGAVLRLIGRQRTPAIGSALAGFGLVILGVSQLQQAMAGHGPLLTTTALDGLDLISRLQLVLLGLLATLITQSSGAGVATTLTGLAAGALTLPQACALVIGMDVGTTVTALIASLGGSLSARRTGLAHVVFNLATALMALVLLPLYLKGLDLAWPGGMGLDVPFALTAFHTGFNLLGVVIALPLTRPFAALIRSLVPEHRGPGPWQLGQHPPADHSVAINLALAAQGALWRQQILLLIDTLGGQPPEPVQLHLEDLARSLGQAEHFLDQLHLVNLNRQQVEALLHLLHALDHLQRLQGRLAEQERTQCLQSAETLAAPRRILLTLLLRIPGDLDQRRWLALQKRCSMVASLLDRQLDQERHGLIARSADGQLSLEDSGLQLDALRWAQRVGHHLDRLSDHLGTATLGLGLNGGRNA